jgi:hypothetical protein
MTALFADTFYWIALADSNDSAHRLALTLTTAFGVSRARPNEVSSAFSPPASSTVL